MLPSIKKKEEIPIQGDDDLKHWHKADVNFNRDKDYGPLYFFYRESTLPINYSDLLTDVHIESKEEKKDLWYLSQDGLPAGVTLVEGQLNTGSGNWIRMYVIKISDEDLV